MSEALIVDDHSIVRRGVADLLQRSSPDTKLRESQGRANLVNEICLPV